MKFDPFKDGFSLPKAEESILEFWTENDVFPKSQELARGRKPFVFFEGPPTANGRPGIHHVIARTVKDLICRYKAMQGFWVDRKGGWDTHGLPVEIEVEKALGLESKAKVVEYGIKEFNQKCRESVFKYLDEWDYITRRTGYWIDLDDAYVTLTNEYIESVWHILKKLFDDGLIYKGYKTIPFCPRCGTGISSHEVAQGYEIVRDPSVYVKVKAADGDFSYLVWTTTPWTLPSNAALCMKADADYVTIEHEDEKLVLAEALVSKLFDEEVKVLDRKKGADFVNQKYQPLFDFYSDKSDEAFFLITADFVTLDDGTGIVHIAPGFGADDYEAGKRVGLPVLQAIESNGVFKDEAGKYAGMYIKDADKEIIKDLKISGKMFKKEMYEHNYPHCWRCHSPLIYIARQSWYIETTKFKDKLIENSNAINWFPDEIRTGRMLNWLENNVDWALSRERFWGTPLPIWICDDKKCGKKVAAGSIEDIKTLSLDSEVEAQETAGTLDLHRPMIDEVKFRCECGGEMSRVPELIDVWFDSGAMPYAQWHYPFENRELFEANFPADFISEAVDQTRGWFYSLLAISTMLFDKAPFKNVIVLEFILDKKGKKMSKHKGNVVDPFETVDKYGADPVRWYLISTSNPWLPTRFDIAGLQEVVRKYFDTLRNTYSFFAIYANIDDLAGRSDKKNLAVEQFLSELAGEPNRFDRWILSRYNSLVAEVTESLDNYEITKPVRAIQQFVIEELSNWYVRNNRRRFWLKDDDPSKMRAYLTLYHLLEGVCRLSAPVSPFVSELLWKELQGESREKHGQPLSVHMTTFPIPDDSAIDKDLEEVMGLAEKVVSLGRAARARRNLKVRQPLATLILSLPDGFDSSRIEPYKDIMQDELNIKEIQTTDSLENYVTFSAKLNFKNAGPRLGQQVKEVSQAVASLESEVVQEFARTKNLNIKVGNGESIELTTEDVDVVRNEKDGYAVESDGQVTVAIRTDLTEELLDEGFAREVVNKIQNMRKTSGFEVTDRIKVTISSSERLEVATTRYRTFIQDETLAQEFDFRREEISGKNAAQWNINGEAATIEVVKI